jgi:outer membrane protein assembly factor BamB
MYLIDQNQLFVGNVVRNASTGQIIANLGGIGRTPPEIIEETIYISNGIQGVTALDRDTFETKWQYKPRTTFLNQPKISTSPVVVLNGIGYVIYNDVTLRAFDPKTGQELGYWQPSWLDLVNQASCFPSRPSCMQLDKAGLATSDDTLFVSFGDGKLYAFSADEP